MSEHTSRALVLGTLGLLDPRHKRQPSLLELSLALGVSMEAIDQAFRLSAGLPATEALDLLSPQHLSECIAPLREQHELEITHSEKGEAEDYTLVYDFYDTPLGELLLASSERGLCLSSFTHAGWECVLDRVAKELHPKALRREAHPYHRVTLNTLTETKPEPLPKLPPLHLFGTPFQRSVWVALTHIPRGKCVHYQDLGRLIGRPRATQAIGTAVGDNPLAPFVPCHRVLPSSNTLGGYYWGTALKARLLLSELHPTHSTS